MATKSKSRFFITDSTDPVSPGMEVRLSSKDAHHAVKVLRLTAGDRIEVVDTETSKAFSATVTECSEGTCSAQVEYLIPSAAPEALSITVIFALSKGKKNELVCEKATELGADNIVIWQTERSVARIDSADDAERKRERWLRIAESAAKQCHRNSVPEITVCRTQAEIAEYLSERPAVRICCALSEEAQYLRELPVPPSSNIQIAIGPEGDFTDTELSFLKDQGFNLVTLGPNILRSETAAIAAISMVEAVFGGASGLHKR